MNLKQSLWILAAFCTPVAANAKPLKTPAVQIRAVLHNPANPDAEFFYPDKKGDPVKLDFQAQDLTPPLLTQSVDGSLVLYGKAAIDPKNPAASVVASVKLPPNVKRAMVVVSAAPAGSSPAYRMDLIDDSAPAFPKGESRIISLVTMETTLEVGEHKLTIRPGEITRLPAVTKLNEYNMAQTSFSYKEGDTPVIFNDRQLQYLEGFRRIFIIHPTAGGSQPGVTTIVDTVEAVPKR